MAAGAFSGKVAKMAKLGTGNGLLQISLPVEPRLSLLNILNKYKI